MIRKMLDILGGVGNVLDLPSSSVRDALAFRNPFDQYLTPTSDENRTSGRELLRNYGLAGQHDTWGNFLGGMAAETAMDPTNLLGGGLIKTAFKRAGAAKAANVGIRQANTKSLAQRAMRYMPEEVAEQTAIKGPDGLPKRMYHGTPHAFDEYDYRRLSDQSLYGKGVYTTENPHIASEYALKDALPPATKYHIKNQAGLAQAYRDLNAKTGYDASGLTDKIAAKQARDLLETSGHHDPASWQVAAQKREGYRLREVV
jgi:hypothetical protein